MKYRVIWDPDAFRRLVRAWTEQLAAFEQEPGGRSLPEILSDLRKRR